MNLTGRVTVTVLAVAATGALAAGVVHPAALAERAGLVAADQPGASQVGLGALPAALVCPPAPRLAEGTEGSDEDFRAEGETVSTTVARAAAEPGDATLGGRTLPAEGDEAAEVAATAPGLAGATTDAQVPVLVEADRSGLLGALQVTRTEDGDLAGLAASSCTAPAETSWLVGGAVEAGRSGRIVLSNPARTTAVVDLTVLTPEGPVVPPAGQDLAVAAGSTREVLLEGLLPATASLAVGVTARGAAVAAALVDTQVSGVDPQGVEQVGAQQPATSATIPGVLAGSRTLTLRLANPGAEPAAVGWQVRGPDGAVVPTGEAVVTVPPGSVVDRPLEVTGQSGPLAVQVGSDQPVASSVQITWPRGLGGQVWSDRAWAGPAPAIDGDALAVAAPEDVRTFLSLTAEDAAEVRVQALDADGELVDDEQVVTVPAGAVQTVPVEAGVAAVRLRVATGTVHAALALTWLDLPRRPNSYFSVVPVQVPPRTTDEVTVSPLPEDVLRQP